MARETNKRSLEKVGEQTVAAPAEKAVKKVALHWFRTDLRVADNPGLSAAQGSGLPVVGLYIATPAQWDAHNDAPIKRDFWRRNLQALAATMQQLGMPLLFAQVASYREIPTLLETLLPALHVHALHCNEEYPLNERQRDEAVAELCQQLGIGMRKHLDQVLVAPKLLLNKSGQAFKVFTPYARAARERLLASPTLCNVRAQQSLVVPSLPELRALADLDFGSREVGTDELEANTWAVNDIDWNECKLRNPTWAARWPAGEDAAQQRLTQFCQQHISDYKNQRDFPAQPGTSIVSPYLAAGVLSIRQCWHAASEWCDGMGVTTWQNELLWHDFYKYTLWHFPHVCKHLPWRTDVGHVPWRHDEQEFRLWREGRTGIPIVDAAMRQLLQTGWMHNRLRMVTAMFLTKHLLIDWRWGERWFMQHLIDGDFAANNGGWQWSASTGTDAVPYFRIFNPVTQSQRFDPEGAFICQYVPELAELDNNTVHAPGLLRPTHYPAPMIDLAFGRERALLAFKRAV